MTTVTYSRRQNEILDALSEIVAVEGFTGITVGDLADRLRCSRRTLYTLANSRDDLITGVVERIFDRWRICAREAAEAAGQGVPAVVASLRARLTVSNAARRPFFDDVAQVPSAQAAYTEYRRDILDDLAALVAEGIRAGEVRPCEPPAVAELLDAGIFRLRHLLQRNPPGITLDAACALLDDLVVHWLGHGKVTFI